MLPYDIPPLILQTIVGYVLNTSSIEARHKCFLSPFLSVDTGNRGGLVSILRGGLVKVKYEPSDPFHKSRQRVPIEVLTISTAREVGTSCGKLGEPELETPRSCDVSTRPSP